MSLQDVGLLVFQLGGLIWIIAFIWLFLVPDREVPAMPAHAFETTALIVLLCAVQNILNPPGKQKRDALLVDESKWEGVEAWLETWRGKPWAPRAPKQAPEVTKQTKGEV